MTRSCVRLPKSLRSWLDGWGDKLSSDFIDAVLAETRFPNLQDNLQSCPRLLVGTDCSGVESPIHALRALNVDHSHVFSCEFAAAPRCVIRDNSPPEFALFEDVTKFEEQAVPRVHLYVAGFSCKPFSMLHVNTRLLQEDQAKIFFATLGRMRTLKPPLAVLENVQGIKRCIEDVQQLIEAEGYVVMYLLLNPVDLGEPVNRPRYYFLCVRNDVSAVTAVEGQAIYERLYMHLKHRVTRQISVEERLLPANHELVRCHQEHRRQKWAKAKESGFPDSSTRTKWKTRHELYKEDFADDFNPTSDLVSPDELFLHLPRERDAWQILSRRKYVEGQDLIADLSQNLGRIPHGLGRVPTITPGSHLVFGRAGRALAPMEKMLLHALPLHKMKFDHSLKDTDFEDMGGNMMHLQTVGVAMLVGMSLVNWASVDEAFAVVPAVAVKSEKSAVVPAVAVKSEKKPTHKLSAAMAKKLESKLRSRFGIACPKSQTKMVKHTTSKKMMATAGKKPHKIACLRGTRWA